MSAKSRTRTPARELLFGNLWEYDPAPETASPQLQDRYTLFVNGKWVAPKTKKFFPSISPRDGETLAEIAHAGAADVDAAYQAAAAA